MNRIQYFDECDDVSTDMIFEKDENGREIKLYSFENVQPCSTYLHYPNIVFSTTHPFIPLREKTMSLGYGTVFETTQDIHLAFEKDPTEKKGTFFFFGYNVENYYHFLYDSLPYLISLLRYPFKETPKILVSYPCQKTTFFPFVLEFFKLLRFDLEIMSPFHRYERVLISTSFTHDGRSELPPRKEIYDFFNSFHSLIPSRSLEMFPKAFYVSRRTWVSGDTSNIGTNYTTRRKMVNEDELVSLLSKYNISEVFTEGMTTEDKIRLFRNASLVIGAIGGGIANVLFSPPETRLMCIVSPTFLNVNGRFRYSFSRVNATYFYDCDHVEKGKLKHFMRVKIKNKGGVGEIEKIEGDEVSVKCSDGSHSGWTEDGKYEMKRYKQGEVEPIDGGLNSPFCVNLEEFEKVLKSVSDKLFLDG